MHLVQPRHLTPLILRVEAVVREVVVGVLQHIVHIFFIKVLILQKTVSLFQIGKVTHKLLQVNTAHFPSVPLGNIRHKFLDIFHPGLEAFIPRLTEDAVCFLVVSLARPLLTLAPETLEVDGCTAHRAVLLRPLVVPRLDAVPAELVPTDERAVGSRRVANLALHCVCW